MLNGLDLFSGIGGIAKALEEWVKPVAYCEVDQYSQAVLLSRMADGQLDTAPIWNDVTTLSGKMLPEIDIITGGFPCQDISTAGTGAGLDGKRSGLFFEIIRLVRELRPRFIFLENVPAITTKGGIRVVSEITSLGYDCRWTNVSAEAVGAPHKRKRWFLLAYSNGDSVWPKQVAIRRRESKTFSQSNGEEEPLAYSYSLRKSQQKRFIEELWRRAGDSGQEERERFQKFPSDRGWWSSEPDVGRVVDGIPNRVDRLKGLGNAVVPLQAKEAFKRLSGLQ